MRVSESLRFRPWRIIGLVAGLVSVPGLVAAQLPYDPPTAIKPPPNVMVAA